MHPVPYGSFDLLQSLAWTSLVIAPAVPIDRLGLIRVQPLELRFVVSPVGSLFAVHRCDLE